MGYKEEVLADNPVMFLPMDEASGGFSNLGSAGGTASVGAGITRGVTDRFGGSTAVTATSGNYITGNIASSVWTDKQFAIEYWFNYTVSDFVGIMSFGANPGAVNSVLGIQHYYNRPRVGYGGTYTDHTQVLGLNDGQWHHMVINSQVNQYNVSSYEYYLDGVYRASVTKNTSFNLSTPFWLGGAGRTLDDFAVYDYTLSASRIAAHYAATDPGGGTTVIPFRGWGIPAY